MHLLKKQKIKIKINEPKIKEMLFSFVILFTYLNELMYKFLLHAS